MADTIPDPGFTFDEALLLDAMIKVTIRTSPEFRGDAVLDSAREKLWRAAMQKHGNDPASFDRAAARFAMRRRMADEDLEV